MSVIENLDAGPNEEQETEFEDLSWEAKADLLLAANDRLRADIELIGVVVEPYSRPEKQRAEEPTPPTARDKVNKATAFLAKIETEFVLQ